MPFSFHKQSIADLVIVEPKVFYDSRGFFLESYKESEFVNAGIMEKFVQDNHSLSKKGVVRGLHYQLPPKPQGKLVRVLKGKVWDVAVDIRKSSPTFLKWIGVELSEENRLMFYIPAGFAHGFIALTDDVHLMYKCTAEYDFNLEKGIIYNDPAIGIKWPDIEKIISDKDLILPQLKDAAIFD